MELLANPITPGVISPIAEVGVGGIGALNTEKTLPTNQSYVGTLAQNGQFRILIDAEYMIVAASSGGSGTSWTVERAVEGSALAAHTAGAKIYHVLTAEGVVAALQSTAKAVAATPYNVLTSDRILLVDNTTAKTVNLPTAVGYSGKLEIKATAAGTNLVTVDGSASQTIDGNLTVTLGSIESTALFNSITLVSDNANWKII